MAASLFERERQARCTELFEELIRRQLHVFLGVPPKQRQQSPGLSLRRASGSKKKRGVLSEEGSSTPGSSSRSADSGSSKRRNSSSSTPQKEKRVPSKADATEEAEDANTKIVERNVQVALEFAKTTCDYHSFGSESPSAVYEELQQLLVSLDAQQQVLKAAALRSCLVRFLSLSAAAAAVGGPRDRHAAAAAVGGTAAAERAAAAEEKRCCVLRLLLALSDTSRGNAADDEQVLLLQLQRQRREQQRRQLQRQREQEEAAAVEDLRLLQQQQHAAYVAAVRSDEGAAASVAEDGLCSSFTGSSSRSSSASYRSSVGSSGRGQSRCRRLRRRSRRRGTSRDAASLYHSCSFAAADCSETGGRAALRTPATERPKREKDGSHSARRARSNGEERSGSAAGRSSMTTCRRSHTCTRPPAGGEPAAGGALGETAAAGERAAARTGEKREARAGTFTARPAVEDCAQQSGDVGYAYDTAMLQQEEEKDARAAAVAAEEETMRSATWLFACAPFEHAVAPAAGAAEPPNAAAGGRSTSTQQPTLLRSGGLHVSVPSRKAALRPGQSLKQVAAEEHGAAAVPAVAEALQLVGVPSAAAGAAEGGCDALTLCPASWGGEREKSRGSHATAAYACAAEQQQPLPAQQLCVSEAWAVQQVLLVLGGFDGTPLFFVNANPAAVASAPAGAPASAVASAAAVAASSASGASDSAVAPAAAAAHAAIVEPPAFRPSLRTAARAAEVSPFAAAVGVALPGAAAPAAAVAAAAATAALEAGRRAKGCSCVLQVSSNFTAEHLSPLCFHRVLHAFVPAASAVLLLSLFVDSCNRSSSTRFAELQTPHTPCRWLPMHCQHRSSTVDLPPASLLQLLCCSSTSGSRPARPDGLRSSSSCERLFENAWCSSRIPAEQTTAAKRGGWAGACVAGLRYALELCLLQWRALLQQLQQQQLAATRQQLVPFDYPAAPCNSCCSHCSADGDLRGYATAGPLPPLFLSPGAATAAVGNPAPPPPGEAAAREEALFTPYAERSRTTASGDTGDTVAEIAAAAAQDETQQQRERPVTLLWLHDVLLPQLRCWEHLAGAIDRALRKTTAALTVWLQQRHPTLPLLLQQREHHPLPQQPGDHIANQQQWQQLEEQQEMPEEQERRLQGRPPLQLISRGYYLPAAFREELQDTATALLVLHVFSEGLQQLQQAELQGHLVLQQLWRFLLLYACRPLLVALDRMLRFGEASGLDAAASVELASLATSCALPFAAACGPSSSKKTIQSSCSVREESYHNSSSSNWSNSNSSMYLFVLRLVTLCDRVGEAVAVRRAMQEQEHEQQQLPGQHQQEENEQERDSRTLIEKEMLTWNQQLAGEESIRRITACLLDRMHCSTAGDPTSAPHSNRRSNSKEEQQRHVLQAAADDYEAAAEVLTLRTEVQRVLQRLQDWRVVQGAAGGWLQQQQQSGQGGQQQEHKSACVAAAETEEEEEKQQRRNQREVKEEKVAVTETLDPVAAATTAYNYGWQQEQLQQEQQQQQREKKRITVLPAADFGEFEPSTALASSTTTSFALLQILSSCSGSAEAAARSSAGPTRPVVGRPQLFCWRMQLPSDSRRSSLRALPSLLSSRSAFRCIRRRTSRSSSRKQGRHRSSSSSMSTTCATAQQARLLPAYLVPTTLLWQQELQQTLRERLQAAKMLLLLQGLRHGLLEAVAVTRAVALLQAEGQIWRVLALLFAEEEAPLAHVDPLQLNMAVREALLFPAAEEQEQQLRPRRQQQKQHRPRQQEQQRGRRQEPQQQQDRREQQGGQQREQQEDRKDHRERLRRDSSSQSRGRMSRRAAAAAPALQKMLLETLRPLLLRHARQLQQQGYTQQQEQEKEQEEETNSCWSDSCSSSVDSSRDSRKSSSSSRISRSREGRRRRGKAAAAGPDAGVPDAFCCPFFSRERLEESARSLTLKLTIENVVLHPPASFGSSCMLAEQQQPQHVDRRQQLQPRIPDTPLEQQRSSSTRLAFAYLTVHQTSVCTSLGSLSSQGVAADGNLAAAAADATAAAAAGGAALWSRWRSLLLHAETMACYSAVFAFLLELQRAEAVLWELPRCFPFFLSCYRQTTAAAAPSAATAARGTEATAPGAAASGGAACGRSTQRDSRAWVSTRDSSTRAGPLLRRQRRHPAAAAEAAVAAAAEAAAAEEEEEDDLWGGAARTRHHKCTLLPPLQERTPAEGAAAAAAASRETATDSGALKNSNSGSSSGRRSGAGVGAAVCKGLMLLRRFCAAVVLLRGELLHLLQCLRRHVASCCSVSSFASRRLFGFLLFCCSLPKMAAAHALHAYFLVALLLVPLDARAAAAAADRAAAAAAALDAASAADAVSAPPLRTQTSAEDCSRAAAAAQTTLPRSTAAAGAASAAVSRTGREAAGGRRPAAADGEQRGRRRAARGSAPATGGGKDRGRVDGAAPGLTAEALDTTDDVDFLPWSCLSAATRAREGAGNAAAAAATALSYQLNAAAAPHVITLLRAALQLQQILRVAAAALRLPHIGDGPGLLLLQRLDAHLYNKPQQDQRERLASSGTKQQQQQLQSHQEQHSRLGTDQQHAGLLCTTPARPADSAAAAAAVCPASPGRGALLQLRDCLHSVEALQFNVRCTALAFVALVRAAVYSSPAASLEGRSSGISSKENCATAAAASVGTEAFACIAAECCSSSSSSISSTAVAGASPICRVCCKSSSIPHEPAAAPARKGGTPRNAVAAAARPAAVEEEAAALQEDECCCCDAAGGDPSARLDVCEEISQGLRLLLSMLDFNRYYLRNVAAASACASFSP